MTETGEDYLSSPCSQIGLSVNIDSTSELSLPLIDRPDNAPQWFDVPNWWDVENEILAFEDSVDIEALLIGRVDLQSLEFHQYWDSQDYLKE